MEALNKAGRHCAGSSGMYERGVHLRTARGKNQTTKTGTEGRSRLEIKRDRERKGRSCREKRLVGGHSQKMR